MLSASRKILSLSSPIVRNVRSLSIPGIEKSDILEHNKESDIYRILMTPRHIPIVLPAMKEFYETENTGAAYKVKIEDHHVLPLAVNYSRYPFSTFVIDKKGEVISLGLMDVVYRDPSKDPNPRVPHYYKEGDPWMAFLNALTYTENRVLELNPHIEKMIDGAAAWTKPSMRGKHISNWVYKNGFDFFWREGPAMGFNDLVTTVTSKENQKHLKAFGLSAVETLPDHAYAGEGYEVVKIPEGNAVIMYQDFKKRLESVKNK